MWFNFIFKNKLEVSLEATFPNFEEEKTEVQINYSTGSQSWALGSLWYETIEMENWEYELL